MDFGRPRSSASRVRQDISAILAPTAHHRAAVRAVRSGAFESTICEREDAQSKENGPMEIARCLGCFNAEKSKGNQKKYAR
jgi:hypothetical protein